MSPQADLAARPPAERRTASIHRRVWVDVWVRSPYHGEMKMTVEIDERRLARFMKIAGISTKTAAIDRALRAAERAARREKLFNTRWSAEDLRGAMDPSYDVLAVRHAPDGR
jgi:Arc/MetJ family transcription regulator